jgi:hypothetical protein
MAIDFSSKITKSEYNDISVLAPYKGKQKELSTENLISNENIKK